MNISHISGDRSIEHALADESDALLEPLTEKGCQCQAMKLFVSLLKKNSLKFASKYIFTDNCEPEQQLGIEREVSRRPYRILLVELRCGCPAHIISNIDVYLGCVHYIHNIVVYVSQKGQS